MNPGGHRKERGSNIMSKLTGEILIVDMVHTCQERIVSYHRQGFEAEQTGEREKADVYYRLSSQ
jgi:hypothetical protein